MDEFTIGELEVASGVPRRTIYFYVQQGILPPPRGAGLAARYQAAHLNRLRAIPRFRAIGWRLDEIREYFAKHAEEAIAAIAQGGSVREGEAREAGTLASPAPAAFAPSNPPVFLARYSLTPGVELLVRRDLPPEVAEQVGRLLASAREIFGPASQPRP